MTAGAFARKCPPNRERRRVRGHHGLFLFAFCLREPVADGTEARVQTVLGRRAPHGQPLPVGDQLVGRDENANRVSSICREACFSQLRRRRSDAQHFLFPLLRREHSDDNTSSSSLYRFLCVFSLTSIYGVIAHMLSCRVGQTCQNTVALDSHQLFVSLRGVEYSPFSLNEYLSRVRACARSKTIGGGEHEVTQPPLRRC